MKPKPALEQLLRRGDVWRGHSRAFVQQEVLSSGFASCNKILLNGGWPKSNLIECCSQHNCFTGEWLLFKPVLNLLFEKHADGYLILLNPPAIPFASALIQQGIPLNRLMIVESKSKQDFIACLIEFTRSSHCLSLLSWQTPFNLNYSELRKCQLACADGSALYVLFRPHHTQTQSSPAPLRVSLGFSDTQLRISVIKQRGVFNHRHAFINIETASAAELTETPFIASQS